MASQGQSVFGEAINLYRVVFADPGRIVRFLGMPAVFSVASALFFQLRSLQYQRQQPDDNQWAEFGLIFLVMVVFQTWAHVRSLSAWSRWVQSGTEPLTFLQPGFGRNEWNVVGWQILYFLMLMIMLLVVFFVARLGFDQASGDQVGPGFWLAALAGVIAFGVALLHVTVRLGVGLVAILLGEPAQFGRYWRAVTPLAWRLTGVVLVSQMLLQVPLLLCNRLIMGEWLAGDAVTSQDVTVSLAWTGVAAIVNFVCVALLAVALARTYKAVTRDAAPAVILPAGLHGEDGR
ncbi:MAG: hypothetical protein PW843_03580 [Azospirillaceae bacterium]|nr:hypothetical protein [Azospirillaceae bacterium]